ncbi:3-oxoacyl-ACP reductase FabG [Candidatus Bathyarchaeota archaeon]|nr:3-oxoacyl-ACP reductase FabG [Candidatus Bathyarchaeota archaeon]
MKLEGKIALVTGASRGIGKAIALTYAREGASVAVNYINNAAEAEQVVDEIKSKGGKAFAVKADVSKTPEVEKMIAEVIKAYGRLDILVNNAGILIPTNLIETTDEEWGRVMDVNLKGPFICSRKAAKTMMKQKYGKIITTSSISGLGCAPTGEGAYGCTKAGLIMLTSVLAQELGPHGVNVNAIAPGWVRTDMTKGKSGAAAAEEVNKRKAGLAAMRRIGDPQDIANLALFLASDESSFITGQVIVADGGRSDFVSHS